MDEYRECRHARAGQPAWEQQNGAESESLGKLADKGKYEKVQSMLPIKQLPEADAGDKCIRF